MLIHKQTFSPPLCSDSCAQFYYYGEAIVPLVLQLLHMVGYRLWGELQGGINYLTKQETTKPQQGANVAHERGDPLLC